MRLLKLLLALTLCLILSVAAFAHPGDTDSSGGHYNRSTGEYHYHHGYSAHQHYDKDCDGILDCPYAFDDKTGSSSAHTQSFVKAEDSKKTTKARTPEEYVMIVGAIVIALCFVVDGVTVIAEKISRKSKK